MKPRKQLMTLACGVLGSLAVWTWPAQATLEVTASVSISSTAEFHAPLASHGTWIEVGSYGRCWRPAAVAVEWRPYCEGHWVSTDCGWYWASDEPWAWACYHYGNWVHDSSYGWVWIPGVEWAPAWVSWRVGGGYCGWTPLPPHGVVIAPTAFVFVESRRFTEPVRPRTVIVNNTTIVNQTTVINGPVRSTRTIGGESGRSAYINQGPDVALVTKASGKKINAVAIHEAARQSDPPTEVARQLKRPEAAAKVENQNQAKPNQPRTEAPNPKQANPRENQPVEKGPGKEKKNQPEIRQPVTPPNTPKPTSAPAPAPGRERERREIEKREVTPTPAPAPTPNVPNVPNEPGRRADRVEPPAPAPNPHQPPGQNPGKQQPRERRVPPGHQDNPGKGPEKNDRDK